MPHTKAGNGQRAQRSRTRAKKYPKRNKVLSKHSISRRGGTRTNPSTTLVYNTTYLKDDLEPVSFFIIYPRIGRYELTELLPKLYKLLQKSTEFIDDKVWTHYPNIDELAEYLFKKVSEITPNGFNWSVNSYNSGYKIVYFKPMPELDNNVGALSLEWVQEYKSNHTLYQLIQYFVYAIQYDFDLMYIKHELTEQVIFDPEIELCGDLNYDRITKEDIKKYEKGGEAYTFIEESKWLYETYYLYEMIEWLYDYVPNGVKEKAIKTWLLKAVEILKNPFSIHDFCYQYEDPDFDNGSALMPYHQLSFEWSFYDNVFRSGDNYREAMGNEIGYVEPVVYGFINNDGHELPKDPELFKGLTDFMSCGRQLYFKYFNKKIEKFYDKRERDISI